MSMSRTTALELAEILRDMAGEAETVADIFDEIADDDNETRRDALESLGQSLGDFLVALRDALPRLEKAYDSAE